MHFDVTTLDDVKADTNQTRQRFIAKRKSRWRDARVAIFKTSNGESGNGNGEWGIFKMGNL